LFTIKIINDLDSHEVILRRGTFAM